MSYLTFKRNNLNSKATKTICLESFGTVLSQYIQLWTFAIIRLLNKPYKNEVTLTGQNAPLKCCQLLGFLTQLKKGNRSLNAENLSPFGQRASKLPAVKL